MSRHYDHFDGSRCRLDHSIWIIEKVRTPKLGEKVGGPCPYCNQYPADGTGAEKLSEWAISVVGSVWQARFWILTGSAGIILVLASMLGFEGSTDDWVTVLIAVVAVLLGAVEIWAGVIYLSWDHARNAMKSRKDSSTS